ncbi:MAG: TrmH family RNA methyltransferase [Verrucomicrobiales bacterium]
MIRVQPISNLELPELAPYRSMQRQHEHRQQGIFVAEGEKVVRRLLESDLSVLSLLLPEKWHQIYRPLLESRGADISVFTAEKELLEQLTGFSMYQGVLAAAKVPPIYTLPELLENRPGPKLFVAVDTISNAQNMGGLVRNCLAFGVHGLIVSETSCSPYLRQAVRSSMGTIFQMPVVECPDLATAIGQLREAKVRCIAAHPHTDQVLLPEADFRGDCCIILGSEGNGITPEVLQACDQAVAIAMHNNVDSLNVGTAGAVFLYEAQRQRASCPPK